jgi:hypothetical protein
LDKAYIGRGKVWEIVEVVETVFELGTRLKENERFLSVRTLDYVEDGDAMTYHENLAL